MSQTCKFKLGDFVRLKTGYSKMQIVDIKLKFTVPGDAYHIITAEYYDPKAKMKCLSKTRHEFDFTFWEEKVDVEDEVETYDRKDIMLYQTKEKKPRYGTYLANDSQGRIVLEMKSPSGVFVEAFKEDDVEEVVPYTFEVEPFRTSRVNRNNWHYISQEGQVVVGDILLSDRGNMYRVVRVNTKNKETKKEFKGRKLVTSRIGDE